MSILDIFTLICSEPRDVSGISASEARSVTVNLIICYNLERLYITGSTETFPLGKEISESSSRPTLTDTMAKLYSLELSDACETY